MNEKEKMNEIKALFLVVLDCIRDEPAAVQFFDLRLLDRMKKAAEWISKDLYGGNNG